MLLEQCLSTSGGKHDIFLHKRLDNIMEKNNQKATEAIKLLGTQGKSGNILDIHSSYICIMFDEKDVCLMKRNEHKC